jgi:hypothetical protein
MPRCKTCPVGDGEATLTALGRGESSAATQDPKDKSMKMLLRAFLILLICSVCLTTAGAGTRQQDPSVAGIYDNFSIGKESGDLEGMRVTIIPAGGGYYVMIQIAQSGAEDPRPEFVKAKVLKTMIIFKLGDEEFTGKVTAAGLTLKNGAGETQMLKRRPCSSIFGPT